jgi:hypothetical protein
VALSDCQAVDSLLYAGLLPVLHGDAVLDSALGCTILSERSRLKTLPRIQFLRPTAAESGEGCASSWVCLHAQALARSEPLGSKPALSAPAGSAGGDTIIRHLAERLRPEWVVFLTDVEGVFDKPPSEQGARLLQLIDVQLGGGWAAAGLGTEVQLACGEHDTTGGIAKKVEEAAVIARLGIPVVIAKAGTAAAELACAQGPAAFLEQAGAAAAGGMVQRATVVRLK